MFEIDFHPWKSKKTVSGYDYSKLIFVTRARMARFSEGPKEIKYIDLSSCSSAHGTPVILQHRYADCKEGKPCGGGIYGSSSIGDGAPDQRDPHALGIYLLRVTPTDINPAEPFQVEFKILNTGTAPIEIPVSPPFCPTSNRTTNHWHLVISALPLL